MGKPLENVRQVKTINVVSSCCMCLTGLLLLLPLFSVHTEKMLIGVLCVTVGAAKICGYFVNDLYRLAFQYDLAIGSFALILGILFLVSPEKFNAMFPNSIGTYAILEGLFKLQIALDTRHFGMRYWLSILLLALLLCMIGILTVMSFYSDPLDENVLRAVALIAIGLGNAWITAYTVHVRAKKKKFTDWLNDESFDEEDA